MSAFVSFLRLRPAVRAAARLGSRRCRPGAAGFTLAEVMMATFVFAIIATGATAALLQSYTLSARARYRDNARAVLHTFSDQFQRLDTSKKVGTTYVLRWLFNPTTTTGATGKGLKWGTMSDSLITDNTVPDTLTVSLGIADATTVSNPVWATVTRETRYVNSDVNTTGATAGADNDAKDSEAAGYLIQAKFSVSYTFKGIAQTESVTVLRSVP